MNTLSFENRVAVVTGAGNGLGRAHALELASRGAKVVVNDIGKQTDDDELEVRTADTVVKEICDLGGEAVANYDSVVDGDKIIQTAIDTWGRIDILVNNAGIAYASPYSNMTEEAWRLMLNVHLEGTHACTRAAWPHMIKQNYGRLLFTSSPVGLYGWELFAHYAAAKAGIIGLAQSLSDEGAKHNIHSNVIAPYASSGMTGGMTTEHQDNSKIRPGYLSQIVAWLTHDSTTENGSVFEAGGGIMHRVRWTLSQPLHLKDDQFTAENIAGHTASGSSVLNDFSGNLYCEVGNPNYIGQELAGDDFLTLFF